MNRNESYQAMDVTSVTAHLAWASLEVMSDGVKEIQVLIAGSEPDVSSLRLGCTEGALLIEQPNLGISPSLTSGHWLEILVRVPKDWKGAMSLSTASGRLKASGLTGTDLELCTVSGGLHVTNFKAITCHLRTVSGSLRASKVVCTKLVLRSVSADVFLEESAFSEGNLDSVSGSFDLMLTAPMDLLNVTTVSGSLSMDAPITAARIRHKSVSGRLRTKGIELNEEGVPITMNSVSGSVILTAMESDQ